MPLVRILVGLILVNLSLSGSLHAATESTELWQVREEQLMSLAKQNALPESFRAGLAIWRNRRSRVRGSNCLAQVCRELHRRH